ncbi:TPA: ATP-binding protein [Vibrio parahaemolyticus]
MKLISLTLENYRGYQERTTIDISDLTALIGKNDIGKTTLLDALGVFFNHKLCKFDATDKCVYSGEQDDVLIGCEFSNLPEQLILDERANTTLQNEFLLNERGNLELFRIFKKGKGNGEYASWCVHPSAKDAKGILYKKNDQLKTIAERRGVDVEDQRINALLRQGIYNSIDDLKLTPQMIPLKAEDGKSVWERISSYLPHFALFRADRPSTDEEAEVQDPMKAAVSNALSELDTELENIKQVVREKTLAVAADTISHLNDIDSKLASELIPEFKVEPNWGSIFKLSLIGNDGVHINKRGSGVRRLILISFFKAEAERIKRDNSRKGVIYAIEEPETSQHPSYQQMLVDAFKELSELDDCQVILTTHVPALAEKIDLGSLRHIHRNDAGDLTVASGQDATYEVIAKDLGVLPDSRAQLIVCLEGPNDIHFFKRLSRNLIAEGIDIPDLNDDPRIVMIPLGGDTLRDWVNSHYLKNLGKPEIHIYDRDMAEPPKYKATVDAVNGRGDGSLAFLTTKRELENYISPRAIKEVFNVDIEIKDDTDVPTTLAGLTAYREGKCKKKLNTLVMDKYSHADLVEMDPNGNILEWMQAIKTNLV